jgi:hypothetical protein
VQSLWGYDPMAKIDPTRVRREFDQAVNMTAAELRDWLQTPESSAVGFVRANSTESVGHASGRRIVTILGKKAVELSDDDYSHMRKVVGYVHRHRAQRPDNIYTSRWRYSLMNWGHDPTKEG